jgi:nicotinate-nucleotide adenylyltransferase
MDNPAAATPSAARPDAPAGKLPTLVRGDARIGLYGGMFDPPHLGHIALAREALSELWLEHLFFIPAAQTPLRSAPAVASVGDRLEMLRRAIAEAAHPRMALLDIEARTGGVNYTVHTVQQLQAAWPRARMVFLLGSDQFAHLHLWHEPQVLAKMVEFAVFDRANCANAAPSPTLARVLQWRRVSGVQHPASSSEIRRRLKQGRKVDEWLPRSVAAYIEEKKLYR